MSPKRSRLDLYLSVLNSIKDGFEKPTRIMYAANMSWKSVQQLLNELVGQGLVSTVISEGKRTKKKYRITEKGIAVLDYLKGAKEIIEVH